MNNPWVSLILCKHFTASPQWRQAQELPNSFPQFTPSKYPFIKPRSNILLSWSWFRRRLLNICSIIFCPYSHSQTLIVENEWEERYKGFIQTFVSSSLYTAFLNERHTLRSQGNIRPNRYLLPCLLFFCYYDLFMACQECPSICSTRTPLAHRH